MPAKTPADRVARINQSVVKAMKDPEVQKTLASLGVNAVGDTPAQFAAYIQSEFTRWQKVIVEADIKP
jgi:tripartite-type tricarboxylate transporter receptor subunit TctC